MKRPPDLPDQRQARYSVTRRAAEPNEPGWVVFLEGSGRAAEAVGHFFIQADAFAYAEWRNREKNL
jgi:hypothetical protein